VISKLEKEFVALMKELNRFVQEKQINLAFAFSNKDPENLGFLSYRGFQECLEERRIVLQSKEYASLFNRLDSN